MLTVYRACLRLYPGDFRDEYARELTLVLADRLRDEPSAVLRALIVLHALVGILLNDRRPGTAACGCRDWYLASAGRRRSDS